VTSFTAVGLGQLDPAIFNTIHGPDVYAVCADDFHMLSYAGLSHFWPPVRERTTRRVARSFNARICPIKDRDALLAFYDLPADWEHLQKTNVIESSVTRPSC
jgi:hypothetical protein